MRITYLYMFTVIAAMSLTELTQTGSVTALQRFHMTSAVIEGKWPCLVVYMYTALALSRIHSLAPPSDIPSIHSLNTCPPPPQYTPSERKDVSANYSFYSCRRLDNQDKQRPLLITSDCLTMPWLTTNEEPEQTCLRIPLLTSSNSQRLSKISANYFRNGRRHSKNFAIESGDL